ncbi:hypothetical protein FPSE5266_20190 [Fusarium pseudograminearum]|nr:hypothetical protein FPSE5266_20190 [Fusarium pseudograminearum]
MQHNVSRYGWPLWRVVAVGSCSFLKCVVVGGDGRGSVKRKAAPVLLSDVFGSRPVNPKKPRLDGSDDEYAPIDDDDEPEVLVDAGVVAAAADESVAQAVNDQGLILM